MSSSLPQTLPGHDGTQTRIESDAVFDKAVAKFKKRLPKSQAETFVQCTIDDVRNQIRDIQNHHGSKRRLRNMERLSKFVEGMLQLGKVVEVFLNLHNGVALIWGPLRFLLLTASTWIDSLDSLLDVYGRVGEVLPDLSRYAQIYKEYPSVHTHLEAYYCDILEFHSNALEVFSRSGWKVFFHSAWKTFKTQFDPILKSLERHRVMLSEEKLTAVMEETQKQGQSIQDKLDQLNKEWQERDQKNIERDLIAHQNQVDQQYRTVESKIDAPDYHEDYEIASQKRFQSTAGHWILSHPLLSEWLELSSNSNRKIYLSGIPGAGKTVLTSSLISYLKERQLKCKDSAESFSLSYFYFKHLQPEKKSMVSLLLALLSQLVAQDESLLDYVYQSCRSADPKRLRSLDEVSRQVSMALQSQTRCFVIIDGLDECPEAPEVLKWFESIMLSQDDTSRSTEYNIRLFISGQRDGIVESQMSDFTTICLETASGHDQDIMAFTVTMAGKIREKFSLDSEVEQEIVSRVTSRADGMFLYAQLVLSNLFSQTSKYDLKRELKAETFPTGLEQANPNKAERDAAKHILGIILCACRPLHWREIQSKFCIDPSKGEADIDRQLVMSCKQLCGSLVDVSYLEPSSPGEEVVDLVHTTAKIYLVQTKEINIGIKNAKMALFCAEYMVSRPLVSGISKLEIQEHATKGYYGFQDYAVAFWWQHTQQVLAAPELETELIRRALQTAYRVVIDIGEIEKTDTFDDSPKGIQSLKNKLEGISQDLRAWESIKICEMRTVAIREGINLLVNQPSKPENTTIPLYGPWRYKCCKPWCQYFSSGFLEAQLQQIHIHQHELPFTCEFQGCFATEVGFETETDFKNHTKRWHPKEEQSLFPTPKQRTSSHRDILKVARMGDLDTIKSLVGQGIISIDYQKGGGKSLLEVAVEKGHLHVVQYLTEMGANVNVTTWKSSPGSLLHLAVTFGHLDIITFLCGLDNVSLGKDGIGRTPLDSAVMITPFQKAMITQLLRKATVEDSRNALLLAIEQGMVMAVIYFANNLDASFFGRALEVAAQEGHLPCLNALLSSGKVDPNAPNPQGSLPLHISCLYGKLPVIQRLHALTTTTDFRNVAGNTPLHIASKGGYDAVVGFLLEGGADINAMNQSSKTPLQLAIDNGHQAVQKLLLDNGAKSNSADGKFAPLVSDSLDYTFGPLFGGSDMELANPLNSRDILSDFDFDSFLHEEGNDF